MSISVLVFAAAEVCTVDTHTSVTTGRMGIATSISYIIRVMTWNLLLLFLKIIPHPLSTCAKSAHLLDRSNVNPLFVFSDFPWSLLSHWFLSFFLGLPWVP